MFRTQVTQCHSTRTYNRPKGHTTTTVHPSVESVRMTEKLNIYDDIIVRTTVRARVQMFTKYNSAYESYVT